VAANNQDVGGATQLSGAISLQISAAHDGLEIGL